jgi:hypothetical protein
VTYFRKQKLQGDNGAFNINLMPPVVLKNCLPCDLYVSFVDSNKQLSRVKLQKEETKDLFQFDLQEDVKLQLTINGFSSATITLKVSGGE